VATITKIEDFEVFQKSRNLAKEIYAVTKNGALHKDFVLRDQLRRAAISVVSNICEGFERDGKGEFIQFLSVAKGSAGEIKGQLYIALDQSYLSASEFERLSQLAGETSKMIAGLMKYLRHSEFSGLKYKNSKSETRN
jgi:four helix bundle protein